MLKDKELFKSVEDLLIENGTIPDFESKNGSIKGRLFITLGEVPCELKIELDKDNEYAFIGTYDFYDMEIGLVLNSKTKEAKSGIWLTPQIEGAEEPSQEWIEYFIDTILKGINEDGSFGYPIYSFMSDTADFTVVPTAFEE